MLKYGLPALLALHLIASPAHAGDRCAALTAQECAKLREGEMLAIRALLAGATVPQINAALDKVEADHKRKHSTPTYGSGLNLPTVDYLPPPWRGGPPETPLGR